MKKRQGDRGGRGTTRAEDAQGIPTQSHVSPSILVYEERTPKWLKRAHHARDTLDWSLKIIPESRPSKQFPVQLEEI